MDQEMKLEILRHLAELTLTVANAETETELEELDNIVDWQEFYEQLLPAIRNKSLISPELAEAIKKAKLDPGAINRLNRIK